MVSSESRVYLRSGHDEHSIVTDLCVDLALCLYTILISSRAVAGASLVFLHPWETLAHPNMPQWR
jgi:hypothetical protein